MRHEDGMTIVEVMVAAMILVVGGLGVLGIVDAATRNTFRAEQSQIVSNVLQAEVEKLRQVPYAELALTSLPAHDSDPESPSSRVASTSFFYTGRNGTGLKPLVYNGGTDGGEAIEGGTVVPGPTPFQIGEVRGDVYRYVVWDTCPSSLCADGKHLKRVVIAVRLDETASGGARRYQEVQGQVVDPDAEPSNFPEQEPGGNDTIAWTLNLTDTTCNHAERQKHPAVSTAHFTHNTRGDCADGGQAGNVPGAPDLLWTSAPDGEVDVKEDYAADLGQAGEEGLQMLPGPACASSAATDLARGVATEPDADTTAFQKVHRWLTPPMPATEGNDDVLLTGDGTLSLWTRTIAAGVYKGEVCAWLFVRTYAEDLITDTAVFSLGPPVSLHFSHFATTWPNPGWTEVSLPLSFGHAEEGGALPLPEGSRLGLALSVGSGTPTGLQFLYDEPSFDSRLQLETAGAKPPGV